MSRLHHDTVTRASTAISSPLPPTLVSERLRGPGHDIWMGWTVANDVLVMAMAGDVCTAGVTPLTGRVEDLVLQFPARTVMLDLSRVGFADARLVSLLAQVERMCFESGSELALTAISPAVRRVLGVCGWPTERSGRRGSRLGAHHGDGELLAVRRGIDPVHN